MLPGLQPSLGLTSSSLPDDALEVGRILDAWGVKGWVKILPHSTDPEALLFAKTWYLQTPDVKFRPGFSLFSGTVSLKVDEAKIHSGTVVAKFTGLDDRNAAEALRGARIFLSRSSFPAASADEYYWVDLIGLNVRQPRRRRPGLRARPDGDRPAFGAVRRIRQHPGRRQQRNCRTHDSLRRSLCRQG